MSDFDNLQVQYLHDERCFQASSLLRPTKQHSKTMNQLKKHEFKEERDLGITLKTAGSFISFHMPSTPLETKPLTRLAHHERALDCVKSGKTQGPGHTPPEKDTRQMLVIAKNEEKRR